MRCFHSTHGLLFRGSAGITRERGSEAAYDPSLRLHLLGIEISLRIMHDNFQGIVVLRTLPRATGVSQALQAQNPKKSGKNVSRKSRTDIFETFSRLFRLFFESFSRLFGAPFCGSLLGSEGPRDSCSSREGSQLLSQQSLLAGATLMSVRVDRTERESRTRSSSGWIKN